MRKAGNSHNAEAPGEDEQVKYKRATEEITVDQLKVVFVILSQDKILTFLTSFFIGSVGQVK